ncbi:hypothetical protein LCGC14_2758160, partial [marine sediment metagenome]
LQLSLSSLSATDGLVIQIYDNVDDGLEVPPLITASDLTGPPLDLSSLQPGTTYWIQVTSPKIPTVYDLLFDFNDGEPDVISLAMRDDWIRRDVILGGEGNDVLIGGAGEDWIFGGPGNDVLSGGADRQAGDLILGNEGNDTFQIIPSGLPLLKGSDQTLIPTTNDTLKGGEGDDRILFLGGDLDDQGRPVPDHVAIRYNIILHRWEFAAQVWDVANQQFLTGPSPARLFINASLPVDIEPVDASFNLSVNGNDPVTVTVTADAIADCDTLDDLVDKLNSALAAVDLSGQVISVLDGDRIALVTTLADFDASLTVANVVDFQGLLGVQEGQSADGDIDGSSAVLHYAFYQASGIERTVIDTRAGNDVVHADPGYVFRGSASQWGIQVGAFQQRGILGALEIYGGDDSDLLFGGPLNDRIYG